ATGIRKGDVEWSAGLGPREKFVQAAQRQRWSLRIDLIEHARHGDRAVLADGVGDPAALVEQSDHGLSQFLAARLEAGIRRALGTSCRPLLPLAPRRVRRSLRR